MSKVIKVMWKVLVAVCLMGQPCTLFVEEPMKYYQTEEECMVAAENKAEGMMETFKEYGYYVDSAAHSCQYIAIKNEV